MVIDFKPDSSSQLASQALELMQRRQIPPTPANFSVWYAVAAESDPSLSRVVSALDAQGVVFDEARNREIYERFFGYERERAEVRRIGDGVEQHLRSIVDLVAQISNGTEAYGASLDGMAQAIGADGAGGGFAHTLNSLRADTERMRGHTNVWRESASSRGVEMAKLKRALTAARNDAETDVLTRVGNRRRFDRRLPEFAELAHKQRKPLCVVMLDIDHFKRFNDTYGHSLGDRVLRLVADRLTKELRAPAELFRYGGEEFAALIPGHALGEAVDVAESLRQAVSMMRVARKSDSAPLRQVTVSLGVSQYAPGEPLSNVVRRADAALYAAKSSGRNCTSAKLAGPCAA